MNEEKKVRVLEVNSLEELLEALKAEIEQIMPELGSFEAQRKRTEEIPMELLPLLAERGYLSSDANPCGTGQLICALVLLAAALNRGMETPKSIWMALAESAYAKAGGHDELMAAAKLVLEPPRERTDA